MSNEHPKSDDMRDAHVSQIYRETAGERTPASLNEAVLRQAAQATGKGYSGSIRWLRPAAWAATILLSLAVVVQFSQIPRPEPMALPSAQTAKPAGIVDRTAQTGADVVERMNEHRQEASADTAPTDEAAFYRDDAPLLEHAENLAKMRSGSDDDQAAAGLASDYASAAFEANSFCGLALQDNPEEWFECIESLESQGLIEAAEEQRRLLAERYPDFEIPED